MVWTETTWLLTAVAALVLLVPLIAIVLSEISGSSFGDDPQVERPRLLDNAELHDEERREALRRFTVQRPTDNR